MLPMGTIITGVMLVALVFATPYAFAKQLKPLPKWVALPVGLLVLAAGGWNVFWYASQHITEYWGIAALISGGLLMITAAYILGFKRIPTLLIQGKPIVLLALLACMLHYGNTIHNL
ncbi:MAG: hypothetical protein V3U65_04300 [Granulosicoccaceae bacterium]